MAARYGQSAMVVGCELPRWFQVPGDRLQTLAGGRSEACNLSPGTWNLLHTSNSQPITHNRPPSLDPMLLPQYDRPES